MAITDSDNRIQLPPTEVDFDNVVGITGQAHDSYPDGGQQPRWDWMRSFLIGLLSMQSSNDPPTQYRIGTPWFDRTRQAVYVWSGTAWTSLSEFIAVATVGTTVVTLDEKLEEVETALLSIQPRMTYSGYCTNNNVYSIPIPSQISDALGANPTELRPLVYINGELADPRKVRFESACPSKIILSGGVKLDQNNVFTVIIERFDIFVVDDVVAS